MRALVPALALSLVACGVNTEPILADADGGANHRSVPQPDVGVDRPPEGGGTDAGIESDEPDLDPALFDSNRVDDPCSDGRPQTCEAEAPACEQAGHVATLRNGCWVCVHPDGCPPLPGTACEADARWVFPCAVGDIAVEWCSCNAEGVAECEVDPGSSELCCGDGSDAICPGMQTECPEGQANATYEGCFACVDAACGEPD